MFDAAQRRLPAMRNGAPSPYLTMTRLPDSKFQKRWDRLIGIDEVKERVLHFLALPDFFATHGGGENLAPGNAILLVGPPGTGKTQLALGSGHRFAVENGKPAVLLEVDAHQLPTANKGGTQQNVIKLFRDIGEVAASGLPVIVVINEVETVASSRADLNSATNPADTAFAVNAFIESMDAIVREHPNAQFILTSNHPEALDRAVVERSDFTITMELPNADARRAILIDALEPLMEAISRYHRNGKGTDRHAPGRGWQTSPELDAVVRKSEGMSPRELRKLVIRALSLAEHPADFTMAHLQMAVDDYVAQREQHRAHGRRAPQ